MGRKKKSVTQNQNPLGSFSKGTTMDQRDRSLTVMIPRAKYHPSHKELMDLEIQGYKSKSSSSNSVNQSKLINYLDASPQTSQTKTKKVSLHITWGHIDRYNNFLIILECAM